MEHEKRHWLFHAVSATLTGWLFGVSLSVVLVLLSLVRFSPVVAIERIGIDLGMRAFTWTPFWTGNLPSNPGAPHYVFFDIDLAACAQGRDTAHAACWTDDAALLAAIVRALRGEPDGQGPRVIILDVTPSSAAMRQLLASGAMAGAGGPWLLVPATGRPMQAPGSFRVEGDERVADGKVRAAGITTFTDPSTNDGVVRDFPPVLRAVGANGNDSGLLPTVPFLAAALSVPDAAAAARNSAAIDCTFYRGAANCPEHQHDVQLGTQHIDLTDLKPAELTPLTAGSGFFYSLPALSSGLYNAPGDLADRYRGTYDLVRVSDLVEPDGSVRVPGALVAGAVVVVGSSDAMARDWHATPLGAMSGPEIVLNAIRAFAEFGMPPHEREPSITREAVSLVWDKMVAVSQLAFFVFLPAWVAIYWLGSLSWLPRFVWRAAAAAVFVGAIAIGFGSEVWEHAGHLRKVRTVAHAVDLLTPVFALGLEGFSHGAKIVLGVFERGSAIVVGRFMLLWRRTMWLARSRRLFWVLVPFVLTGVDTAHGQALRAVGQVVRIHANSPDDVLIAHLGQAAPVRARLYDLLMPGDALIVRSADASAVVFDAERHRSESVAMSTGPWSSSGAQASYAERGGEWFGQVFGSLFQTPRRPIPVEMMARSGDARPSVVASPFLPPGRQTVPRSAIILAAIWSGSPARVELLNAEGIVVGSVDSTPRTDVTFNNVSALGVRSVVIVDTALHWTVETSTTAVPEPPWIGSGVSTTVQDRVIRAAWLLRNGPAEWHMFGLTELSVLAPTSLAADRLWQAVQAGDFPR